MTMETFIGKQESNLKDYLDKFKKAVEDDEAEPIEILDEMKQSCINDFNMYMELIISNTYPVEKVQKKLKHLANQIIVIRDMIKAEC